MAPCRHRESRPVQARKAGQAEFARLDAGEAGGFRGRDRVIAFRTLLSYLTGAVQVERFGSLTGAGTGVLASLSPQQYPHLSKTAQDAQSVAPDEEFLRGLDIVLGGPIRAKRSPALRRPG